jgi:hypothetical protein
MNTQINATTLAMLHSGTITPVNCMYDLLTDREQMLTLDIGQFDGQL